MMPARMIVLLLIMSGDVEENPGPGMEELLDSVCSTEHLNKIAANFTYDWKVVGRRLVHSQDVADIEKEGHSEQDKRDKLFEVWKRRKGFGATYREMMNAFDEVKNQQCVEMVKDLLSDIAHGASQSGNTIPSSAVSPFSVEIIAGDIDLNEKDVIGEGGQGCVYKAYWKVKQKPVAVKKMRELSNATKREIETLRSVRHRNIVTFYGVYEITSQRFCLVFELADTSLDQHLIRSTPNSETSLNWAEQVAQGMHYLHFDVPEPIIHGDLKSPNVLVYTDGVLKIGDFGSSKFKVGQQSSVTRTTFQWTAPELFDDEKHSMESDVYAFGILLWEMVTHKVPYEGLQLPKVFKKVTQNQRPDIPSDSCNETVKEIIHKCWDSDPKKRPSFKIVLKRLEAAKDTDTHTHTSSAAVGPDLTEGELPQKVRVIRKGKAKMSIIKPVVLNANADQLYAVEQAHYAAYHFCVASDKEAGNGQADEHFASVFGVKRISENEMAARAIYQKICAALTNDVIVYVVDDDSYPGVAASKYNGVPTVIIQLQFFSFPFASTANSQVSSLVHKLSRCVANTRDDDKEGNVKNAFRIQNFAISTLPINYGIDTTCIINGEVRVTKGNFYYRYLDSDGSRIDPTYPLPLQKNWGTLPELFAFGFDTVLVLKSNGNIFVTSGSQYIRYSDKMAQVVDSGYPRPIVGNWGNLPTSFNEGFDCAFYLNQNTYVTKGTEYIRYSDPNASVVDSGYPANVFTGFGNVFHTIDAAAYFPNGHTYVTSADQYVRYSGQWPSKVDSGYPIPIRGKWGSAPSVN